MTSGVEEAGGLAGEIPDEPFLLYDGECPFCSFYVAKSRFEARVGKPLRLIDGRKAPGLAAQMLLEGFDLETGMILALDGRRLHGAEAMTALEGMSAGAEGFAGLARRFASSPGRVRRAYPWLRRLRRLALRAKGRPGFGN